MSDAATALRDAAARAPASAWENQVARNAFDEPEFTVLPRASELPTRESVSINPAALILPHPVDRYLAQDASPIPEAPDRAGYYGPRHFEYWLSGLEHHQVVVDLMTQHGVERGSILDFGGASGRVIRHMAAYGTFRELWACDLNWRFIAWMQRFLPRSIRALHTSAVPHLPFEDRSLDCVMAWSVFSHIGVFETAWLAELRRILKPGGLALLTVVTEHQLANPDWAARTGFVETPRWHAGFLEELKQRGKIVVHIGGSNVAYDTNYLHDTWGRLFTIVDHKRAFPRSQDLMVLRKP